MPRTKLPIGSVPVTFRLPRQIQAILAGKARREELSFSELIRRALRRKIETAGRVTEIKTNGGETKVAFGYDHANRKIWEDQTVAGLPTRRVETNPDDDGNRATLSVPGVPGAYSFTYQYTQRQQLRHINRGGSPYVEYSYDVNNNLTKRQHMAQGQGHDSTRFQYDDINRVTQCEQTGPNDQLFARNNYNDYDLVNNLKSILREEDGNKGEIFGYDDANQLQSVSYKADIDPRAPEPGGDPGAVAAVAEDVERESVAALEADPDREPLALLGAEPEPEVAIGPRTVTYTNDAINRLSMHDGATGQTTSYTPNYLNQYTAVTGQGMLSYDDKFNLSGYDGWTYVYDAEKRLVSANAAGHNAQFVYDGTGRCVKRTIDGAVTVFTYEEWKPIVEWTGGGDFVAWNLYGPGADEILVRYQPNIGGHLNYHLDALGNVQFLLSGESHLGLEKYTYDVFGKPTITGWNGDARPISQHGNRFLFTGREYLYTLGIYDYRHRKYHPRLGRFMQVDPIGFKGDPLNLYRYCGSNPVNRSDPMGLDYDLKKDPSDSNHFIAEVPIQFIGGTKGDAREFSQGLENAWKGQDVRGRTLTAKVVPLQGLGAQLKSALPWKTYNSVTFKSTGDTEVKLGRFVYVNLIKGQWTTREKGAHEGGHLLNRKDGYERDADGDPVMEGGRPKPQEGYDRDNVMVYPPGKPSPADIGAVIDGNGRGHGGCLPDGRQTFDAFGSTTTHASEWAKTWGPGGWLATDRR